MSNININLSVLKEDVSSYLKNGLKFISSSIRTANLISFPADASFLAELQEIKTILATIQSDINSSLGILKNIVQTFNQVENSNKRYLSKIDDSYRVKDLNPKESKQTSPQKA